MARDRSRIAPAKGDVMRCVLIAVMLAIATGCASTYQEPPWGLRFHDVPTDPAPGSAFRDCDYCPEMIVIPAGDFIWEADEGDNASPPGARETISIRRFSASRNGVSVDEWVACVVRGGCRTHHYGWGDGVGDGERGVKGISWDDAQAYARWLSRETGREYRLLTAAEWQYASGVRERASGGRRAYIRPLRLYRTYGGYEWLQDCAAPYLRRVSEHEWVWDGRLPSDGSAREAAPCESRIAYTLRGPRDWGGGGFLAIADEPDFGFRVARTDPPTGRAVSDGFPPARR